MNKKLNKKAIIIASIVIVAFIVGYFIYERNANLNKKEVDSSKDKLESTTVELDSKDINNYEEINPDNIEEQNNNYLIEGNFLEDGIVSETELSAMNQNTKTLQSLIDTAEIGQTIKIPSGTYYFTSGGTNITGNENYVIKLKSNISIEGEGTSTNSTILKPYATSGTINYGLDMFYYNEYSDSNFTNPAYIENISFNDFIIDGESVRGNNYNTSGKGFMINLCKNCTWDNITVKNTDGTGFGMDNVINGKITNSTAINCGKNATKTSEGASGFGIGTGYSNEESMIIENCKSIGNTKYGFFFEHQNLYSKHYTATSSNGFIVKNSYATGNLYNFGGKRANDVTYTNCSSDIDNTTNDGTSINYTLLDIYFDDQSRRTTVTNFKTDNIFKDVKTSTYYYDAIKWGYTNGFILENSDYTFGVGIPATRGQAIALLWRYDGRQGNVLTLSELNSANYKTTNIQTGFNDVPGDIWYASAVKWGKEKGITNGTTLTTFSPERPITRAEFIMMLWRYAGSPQVGAKMAFTDVPQNSIYYDAINWAYQKGIAKGITSTTFEPSSNCIREQVVTFLYRYAML